MVSNICSPFALFCPLYIVSVHGKLILSIFLCTVSILFCFCPHLFIFAYLIICQIWICDFRLCEVFNSWISEARLLPVVQMFDHIRIQIMTRMNTRRTTAEKFYPSFGISIHFCTIMSTFWYFCLTISIFIHICTILSTFWHLCPPFGICVHTYTIMSTFWHFCPDFKISGGLWTW